MKQIIFIVLSGKNVQNNNNMYLRFSCMLAEDMKIFYFSYETVKFYNFPKN